MKNEKLFPLVFMLLTACFMLFSAIINAQTTIGLKDCIQYGLTHNAEMQKSKLETDKSSYKVMETTSGYLPQVKANGSINDNLKLQTSILPGEIFGQPGQSVAVQFGTQYNTTAGLDVNQVIFDPSLISGIQVSKQSRLMSSLNEVRTEEQVIYDIASAYYAAQITASQKSIVISNLKNLDTLILITKSKYDNGFAKKTDYDRVIVNQTNAKTQIDNLEMNYQQQLRLLKYYMGMPLDSTIEIFPILNETLIVKNNVLDISATTDLKILQMQKQMNVLNMKQVRAGYMPSLSLGFRYAYQLQQNSFDIFSSSAKWFPNSYLALSLNVPIFDGLNKYSKVQQIKIQIMESDLDIKNKTAFLNMQFQNANSKMQTSSSALSIQQKNIQLAEELYKSTQAQFQMGLASLSDLLNAETSLKESQSNYLQALVQIKIAELDLLKSTGNIKTLTQ